ncbi:MAG: hypothetical protein GF309_12580 [Candidatus Lokiarchaeota archaeon]|nr:hypothetical protein [Candidatus Lokiarchaeota archaeon]
MSIEKIKKKLLKSDDNLKNSEIQDPIELALHGKKFTEISLEDIERVSENEQSKYTENSS